MKKFNIFHNIQNCVYPMGILILLLGASCDVAPQQDDTTPNYETEEQFYMRMFGDTFLYTAGRVYLDIDKDPASATYKHIEWRVGSYIDIPKLKNISVRFFKSYGGHENCFGYTYTNKEHLVEITVRTDTVKDTFADDYGRRYITVIQEVNNGSYRIGNGEIVIKKKSDVEKETISLKNQIKNKVFRDTSKTTFADFQNENTLLFQGKTYEYHATEIPYLTKGYALVYINNDYSVITLSKNNNDIWTLRHYTRGYTGETSYSGIITDYVGVIRSRLAHKTIYTTGGSFYGIFDQNGNYTGQTPKSAGNNHSLSILNSAALDEAIYQNVENNYTINIKIENDTVILLDGTSFELR